MWAREGFDNTHQRTTGFSEASFVARPDRDHRDWAATWICQSGIYQSPQFLWSEFQATSLRHQTSHKGELLLNKGLPPHHFLKKTTNVEIALCLPSNASLNLFQWPMGLSIHGVCWRPFGTSKYYNGDTYLIESYAHIQRKAGETFTCQMKRIAWSHGNNYS